MIAPLFLLAAVQLGSNSDPRRTYAAGDKDAVLMLPPVGVCDADVREMVWSADGSSLVVRRTFSEATAADVAAAVSGKMPPELAARFESKAELLVWSARSHRVRVVASGTSRNLDVSEVRAMPLSDRVMVGAVERSTDADGAVKEAIAVSMIATGSGTVTRLAISDDVTPYLGFELSPSRPIGYVLGFQRDKARAVRFFGPDGRLGNAIILPVKSTMGFDESGLPTLFLGHERRGKDIIEHCQKVNATAGTLGETFDRASLPEPASPKTILESVETSGTTDGSRAPSILLRVAGGKPGEAGVVTTDGTGGLISPKGDAVAYLAQGSAVVRPLARVARAEYDAAILAAKKAVAMSNAKQAGLAILMFAGDHDDRYPGQSEIDGIMPYLKDQGIFGSFSYTYGGGLATDIDKPAEQEIGYVSGPGGRAVVYSDGHVKWRPDAP